MNFLLKVDLRAGYYGWGKLAKNCSIFKARYLSPRYGELCGQYEMTTELDTLCKYCVAIWSVFFDWIPIRVGFHTRLSYVLCQNAQSWKGNDIQNRINMYITNKPSLNSLHFSERGWWSFICEYFRIYHQFNFEHDVAARRTVWPIPGLARISSKVLFQNLHFWRLPLVSRLSIF